MGSKQISLPENIYNINNLFEKKYVLQEENPFKFYKKIYKYYFKIGCFFRLNPLTFKKKTWFLNWFLRARICKTEKCPEYNLRQDNNRSFKKQ